MPLSPDGSTKILFVFEGFCKTNQLLKLLLNSHCALEVSIVYFNMINELVSDYSDYLRVDLERELHDVQDTIDDMLTRLDEFENLVNMVKADNELCSSISIPVIIQSKEKLDLLFSQVDSLEKFVYHVKSNVEVVEAQVLEAEEEMGQNTHSFKKMLKPLFSKISPSSTSSQRTIRTYETPVLFSTDKYFSSESEPDVVQKDPKS